ncbi:helix-turn-helix domain-containing protein [Roseomonas gilardii]|uniref:helix-turn-helix domain-containing protein n=1 Tax=Roseomonas gilardii TaxID=257708 RepID=UPI00138E276C
MSPTGIATQPRRRGRPPEAARHAEGADDTAGPRVEAVERALSILDAFSNETPRLSLAEIAARTGFYPSTILRLAASLDRFGYLHRGEDGSASVRRRCAWACSTATPSTSPGTSALCWRACGAYGRDGGLLRPRG